MQVKVAKQVARHWVEAQADTSPNMVGAFLHGSILWLPDEAELEPTSDVDVMLVLDTQAAPLKLGKFVYHGVLLEISYLTRQELGSAEELLANYQLAGSLRTTSILADPRGFLTPLQAAVALGFARRDWVERRCEHARAKILQHLDGSRHAAALHDQVIGWLFAAGVTTHVLLTAGLQNPTVRRRYVAVRELLGSTGLERFHEELLELIGAAHLRPEQVAHHVDALANAFDAAKTWLQTPLFFASDLSDVARPIAVDGSRDLIARGLHREAVFWIAATYSRCQKVLAQDAPPSVQARFTPGYLDLLMDLGVATPEELEARREAVAIFLPRLMEVTKHILAANRQIVP